MKTKQLSKNINNAIEDEKEVIANRLKQLEILLLISSGYNQLAETSLYDMSNVDRLAIEKLTNSHLIEISILGNVFQLTPKGSMFIDIIKSQI